MIDRTNRILNKTEAADRIGCHRHTLTKWIAKGIGPGFKRLPGGREYTTERACDEFLKELEGGDE